MKHLLLTFVILHSALGIVASAADIVALVIGNNSYTRVEDTLDTPINDATLMKRTLEALPVGADVKILTDATKESIEIALNALKVRAQGAKLALVFYSGHGTEDQPDGFPQNETFLLPVDANIPDVNYLPTRAVSLSTVLAALKAAPVTARAVILDCCRSGAPKATAALAGGTKSFGTLDERVKKALGNAVVPDATLIAFAASPGRKAAAFLSDSDENSPFTKFLTDQLATGTGNLRDLVEAAAETTETETGRRQVPYVSYIGAASAIKQIIFRTSPAAMPDKTPVITAKMEHSPKGSVTTVQNHRTNELPQNPITGSGIPTSTTKSAWETMTIGGRDYVTAENIRDFYNPVYGFTTFRFQDDQFWLGSSKLILKALSGSREILINNIKFILDFPVIENDGKVLFSRFDLCCLIDPVLCPSHIKNAEDFDTVVIDAGHGGADTGNRGVHGDEKIFTLELAFVLSDALKERGFKVVMTRAADTFITQGDRVKIANATAKSIFISLQFNSGSSDTTGIETFVLTPPDDTADNKQDTASISLAAAVHSNVISRFKFVDLGMKRPQSSALVGCERPGIIFKGGFVTNDKECLLIASDNYRQKVSTAIADAVVNYRKALESAIKPVP